MPRQRSFKSMFVEVISFLTLFALIGTMTSNFWERYLIQTELSNMKSSLHLLKETVYNIGAAYDHLHYELRDLVDTNEVKSTKSSIPKVHQHSQHKDTQDLNTFSKVVVVRENSEFKANKSIGHAATETTRASKATENVHPHKESMKAYLKNATTATRNPLKSTGISVEPERKEKLSPPSNHYKNNIMANHLHKCWKEDQCCGFNFDFRKF